MRKHGVVFALCVVSVAVWVASASAISSPQTFSLLEVSGNNDQPLGDFTFDRPPAGGDRIAFTNKLYKWAGTKKGAPAGRDQVMISFITGFGSDFSMKATALFTAQVFLTGRNDFRRGVRSDQPQRPFEVQVPDTRRNRQVRQRSRLRQRA